MPTYNFYCRSCDRSHTKVFAMKDAKLSIPCPDCKKKANRDYSGTKTQSTTGWPLHSDAMAVHPEQIGEARADAIKRGVKTDFDSYGRPILTSRGHRRAYARAYGFFDRNGSYGDP